jgi:hypothetical protein
MKQNYLRLVILVFALIFTFNVGWAQQPAIQFFRSNDKRGLNVYETTKVDTIPYTDFKLRFGGAFTMQYQGLDHQNAANNLIPISHNFNLPNANMDFDVQLYDGVRMHLRVYLSSRHHEETYVKGGYLQIDKLDFIKKDFLKEFMKKATIKIGQMENNYGDAHFRRTDNAHALFNPFVGNYIMDSFTTELGAEVYYQTNGWLIMVGATNGRLNQSVTNTTSKGALLAKLGYDKKLNDDLRIRLTGSIYTVSGTNKVYLYGGDRAGSRYYNVMDAVNATPNDFSGRINPGLNTNMTSVMINPSVKFKGLEFFGMYENSTGRDDAADVTFTGNRSWTQIAGEALYRFGSKEQLYIGARYNSVSGQLPGEPTAKVSVDRVNMGGGWFMTRNILTKLEYVSQNYKDYPGGSSFQGGKFNGFIIEATVAF